MSLLFPKENWNTSKMSLHKLSFVRRSFRSYPKFLADLYTFSYRDRITCNYFLNQKAGGVTLKEEDIVVCNVIIDLTCGRNNPIERYVIKSYINNYDGLFTCLFELFDGFIIF
ncbi:hypothetical protein U1Q18_031982 [Sarracenia purpurea var. burkii]